MLLILSCISAPVWSFVGNEPRRGDFQITKTQGLNIEGSELEEGLTIRKLCVLTLSSIGDGQHIDEVFTETEQQCLNDLNKKLSGKTQKQSNLYNKTQLQMGYIDYQQA